MAKFTDTACMVEKMKITRNDVEHVTLLELGRG
jgi:hypothetical protein